MTFNLIYMAKPIYGGWGTFTAHLILKYNCELFKIGKRTEPNKRDFGYNVEYRNLRIDELIKKDNLVITALDKHYWKYLHLFPKGTKIIIHDPTEIKGKNNKLLELLNNFKIITIRKTVKELLQTKYNTDSIFLHHPFYMYPKLNNNSDNYALSISRIDFDKNIEHILRANEYLDESRKIYLFGAENRLYVHHKLKEMNFEKYWKGKYPKQLPLQYNGKDLLNNCSFVIDMSTINGDGGGTQYTFLEAIYHECALILNIDWVNKGDLFKDRYNCYVVGYTNDIGKEISTIINNGHENEEYKNIIKNATKIMDNHKSPEWNKYLI